MAEYVNPDYVPEPEKVNVKKGLEGAVIDTSGVSKVNPDTNSLIYRGYPVQDLAENCRFEEVAYLLYNGELPTQAQLKEFEEMLLPFRFCRVHNMHLINLNYVRKYLRGDGGRVIMENGDEIDVSRRKKDDFLKLINHQG